MVNIAVFKMLPLEASTAEGTGIKGCRKVLLELLTGVLLGDGLAAEYTLLHLFSSV